MRRAKLRVRDEPFTLTGRGLGVICEFVDTVHPEHRRRGIGTEVVRRATAAARERGARWLRVYHEPRLDGFYRGCGFRHALAGLIDLGARTSHQPPA